MQMKTAADYPQKNGVITGFSVAGTEYLELISEDLCLGMSLQTLSFIQNYYKSMLRRDASVEEIIMLDILICNAEARRDGGVAPSLAEMTTDSDEIRDTFEDMMCKRSALFPTRKGPVALDELMNISGRYMNNIFPERYSAERTVCHVYEEAPAFLSKLDMSRESYEYKAGEMSFALASEPERTVIKDGVYIQIEKNDASEGFIDVLRAEKIEFSASRVRGSIIEAIMADADRAEITVPYSLPTLASFGDGDMLILCRAEQEQRIVQLGLQHSLRMRHAGRRLKKGGIRFKNPLFEYGFSALFLRTLTAPKRSPQGDELLSVCIDRDTLCGKSDCRFDTVSSECERENTAIISASSSMSSPFESGIHQIVCAYAGAVALGASIGDIRLKSVIRYPADSDPAVLIAHILGMYRAETELCVSSADNELKWSSDLSEPVSRTVAVSDKGFAGGVGEGSLWIVSPEEKDGEICFENIRRSFAYMTALISEGHVIRACALDSDGFGESEERYSVPIGSFLVLTRAELVPSDGVKTEKVGEVGSFSDGESPLLM